MGQAFDVVKETVRLGIERTAFDQNYVKNAQEN